MSLCRCGCGRPLRRGAIWATRPCFNASRRRPVKVCPVCHEPFAPTYARQVYCSHSCAGIALWDRRGDAGAQIAKARDAQRTKYVARVLAEVHAMLPQQATFTRGEVARLFLTYRKAIYNKGYRARWQQEHRKARAA